METTSLQALSPVDGRYAAITAPLRAYYSEEALIRNRVRVEVAYLLALIEAKLGNLVDFPTTQKADIERIATEFNTHDAAAIKLIEKTTNHDVKAVEYFIKEKLDALGLSAWSEWIHFGLTSQDINNTAIPLAMREADQQLMWPLWDGLVQQLTHLSEQWKAIPMLARTHGQAASPTRLGKELYVFVERIQIQLNTWKNIPYACKFGGATGNFNAHYVAFPAVDWVQFSNTFCTKALGLTRSQTTTQIEHYDQLAAWCDVQKRLNTILIDLCRDIWTYISMDYFKQKIVAHEVGSSAMPHKVNPIDFENAEGNLGLANALFSFMSEKLPISRLQRDLTDSTVLRNVGVPIAHTYIALQSLSKGLNKLVLNEVAITADLDKNYAVIAEAIQTILRRENYPQPYEALKKLTRTEGGITPQVMLDFIEGLHVSNEIKAELRAITPHNYTGIQTF